MRRFTRRQTTIGAIATVAIAVAGYVVYKTFPHLTEPEDKTKTEKTETETETEDKTSDVTSVKSLVEEVEK